MKEIKQRKKETIKARITQRQNSKIEEERNEETYKTVAETEYQARKKGSKKVTTKEKRNAERVNSRKE